MENILPNLNIKRLCSAGGRKKKVSGWCCSGEKKPKFPCLCLGQNVFCAECDVLPPSVEASVVRCSRLTWTPPPQGSSSSRNDRPHQAGDDGVTGNLLLSDRPCHTLKHSCLLKDFLHPGAPSAQASFSRYFCVFRDTEKSR